ncbi:hypothetical protein D9615_008761 [Tricholomella constricta]|uniref:BTB domain-containing protein n=1 Tax=Tricholomella constricta TaxID=117010 RepID=A0A8H5M2J4_9AGAR|nr:hypothetical protein D9615_008761 [Tricholomella constricta]
MMMSTFRDTTNVTRHPVFWFNDGSVVFRVQDHAFKVHRTLLSRHSRFFAYSDHAHVPTSTNLNVASDLEYEIHIVVDPSRRVQVKDVEVLLEHFYHDAPLFSEVRFPRLAAVLRVSSPLQLDFPSIHALARERLNSIFPSPVLPLFRPEDPEEALALAKEYEIPSMQKALYYHFVTSSDAHLDDEATLELGPTPLPSDPETVEAPEHLGPDPNAHAQHASRRPLSLTDAKLCTRLMTRLIDHFTPILFTPPATPHMACTDVFADTWMALVIQPAIENDGVYKPLETLEGMKNTDWEKKGLCRGCVKEKEEEWTREQRVIWGAMDGWLGLGVEGSDVGTGIY